MGAAIALAIVLVVAVAGVSLAMQSQQTGRTEQQRIRRPSMPSRKPGGTGSSSGRIRRIKDQPPAPPAEPPTPQAGPKGPELLRSGVSARAKVVNVVDERVVGPVTRSRLTLSITPPEGEPFEVSLRHAFPTAEARGQVKVGGTIGVRYDKDDHRKVVLDIAGAPGSS